MHNVEIRVGNSDDLGDNEICHKQFDFMDSPQANITCSRDLYGDWVSGNSTATGLASDVLALKEVRVFRG